MKEIIILGIGSRLLMDDGIGIYITEKLQSKNTRDDFKFIIGETDIDYCMRIIEGADFLVIIDALYSGLNPGDITVLPLKDILRQTSPGFSIHNFHLLDNISTIKTDLPGIFIGVEPFKIDYGIGLSTTLKKLYLHILKEIQTIIEKIPVTS